MRTQWVCINIDTAAYVGLIEHLEYDYLFEVFNNGTHLVGGSCCNTGLLQSWSYEIDDCFSLEENLTDLLHELDVFYCEGSAATDDRFKHNDRMGVDAVSKLIYTVITDAGVSYDASETEHGAKCIATRDGYNAIGIRNVNHYYVTTTHVKVDGKWYVNGEQPEDAA